MSLNSLTIFISISASYMILFNRFHFELNARKNINYVVLERKLHHNQVSYELIGSIHHHGDSISSGHYTSKINFTDVVYDCNAHIITKAIPCDEVSNSVYIAIYRPTD